MAATRSRTDRWKDYLKKICERNGPIEISLPSRSDEQGNKLPNLIWRVRILDLSETQIIVEQPSAIKKSISLAPGTPLVAVLSVGQNRWMFHTTVQEVGTAASRFGRDVPVLHLSMPDKVERVMRRQFLRISTAALEIPKVRVMPLLEPGSVVAAEVANRAALIEATNAREQNKPYEHLQTVLPEVGPALDAHLMNLGGGGLGLIIAPDDARAIDQFHLFWIQIDLRPQIPVPLGLTVRMVHTHLDSSQNLYAGMALDFALNPSHEPFVVEQICNYIALCQASGIKAA